MCPRLRLLRDAVGDRGHGSTLATMTERLPGPPPAETRTILPFALRMRYSAATNVDTCGSPGPPRRTPHSHRRAGVGPGHAPHETKRRPAHHRNGTIREIPDVGEQSATPRRPSHHRIIRRSHPTPTRTRPFTRHRTHRAARTTRTRRTPPHDEAHPPNRPLDRRRPPWALRRSHRRAERPTSGTGRRSPRPRLAHRLDGRGQLSPASAVDVLPERRCRGGQGPQDLP